MLQFTRIFARNSTSSAVLSSIIRYNNYSSSTSSPELKNLQSSPVESEIRVRQRTQILSQAEANIKGHKTMVEAAFASLKSDNAGIKTPSTDNKVAKAQTLDELLTISEGNGVSRKHALRVVSILADWSSSGKVNQVEFETDPRFLRLCRVLTKGGPKNARNSPASRSDDLSTILSVTADDEAAKLVGSITLAQMVKVMSTLSQTKRRSTLLLRALAYNITGNSDQLDLKQCSDLLFSMSTLNFLDENLLTRVANDISVELEKNIKKSSVVGSILTSIGLLKYKNTVLLDTLSEWVVKNHYLCRPQDIFSLFMTLGILNYYPINSDQCFEVLLPQLTRSEAGKPLVWLEIVWSLVLLNKANCDHVASILCSEFLESLGAENSLTISTNLKLLNIDAAAEYQIENYNGPRIAPTSAIRNTKILQTKEKVKMVDAVLVSLKNLIQSENLLRTRINTGHGFLIDAVCLLVKKCNPLPLEQVNSNKTATRVAILAYDYHDMSRGKVEPTGINVLATNFLKAQGYKILTVPYTEFNLRDKLIHRVQYLEAKLKEIVK